MRTFKFIDGSTRKTDRNFYFSGHLQCEGCGLHRLKEPSVMWRPEVGRMTCNDCVSPNGYAASVNMLVEPDPLRMLASVITSRRRRRSSKCDPGRDQSS